MTEQSPGWYPDPNDVRSEIYWDGVRWHGQRQTEDNPSQHAPISRPNGGATTPRPNVIPATWVLAWRRLATGAKVVIVVAVITFVAVVIAWLASAPWESQAEKDCKAEAQLQRIPSDQVDYFVDNCVNFSKR